MVTAQMQVSRFLNPVAICLKCQYLMERKSGKNQKSSAVCLFVFSEHSRLKLFLFEKDLNKYEIPINVTLQHIQSWVHPWKVTGRKLLITRNQGCVCSLVHHVLAKYLLNHFAWLLSFLPRNQCYWRWMTAVTWQAWLHCE